MSHEPECPKSTQRVYAGDNCPACDVIRAAYQRGRKDASEAAYEWLIDDTRHTDQSLIDACMGVDQ
jgi:hypothetical protein